MPMTHAPETGARKLASVSGASVIQSVPNFSGARFWSRIEHVLFRDRIWRTRDQNITDL